MDGRAQHLDAYLAWLAGRQKGVVARWQILKGGFSARQVDRKVASGSLIPVHPGVYLVGHRAMPALAMEAAALLACMPRAAPVRRRVLAALSDRTAGRIWAWPVPAQGPVQVTVVGPPRRGPASVLVRRIDQLPPSEIRRHEGLPVTSPSLTILDLAGDHAIDLPAVLNEARVSRQVRDDELRSTLERHPNRRGARRLRKTLDSEHGPRITHSEAERRALAMMKRHGLVPDATQHRIGQHRVDFWFERERVAVEIDGFRYHATPTRFVEDRRRMAELAARDVQVLPITWADLGDPVATTGRLSAALAARRPR